MASLFYYTARRRDGMFVRGSLQASNAGAALATLRSRALAVTSLELSGTAKAFTAAVFQGGSISRRSLCGFLRSFATLVSAGVSLRRSLEVASEECRDVRLREALDAVGSDIESGHSLSEALAHRPREFPQLLVATVKAGEVGGVLDEVLERLARWFEREQALHKKLLAVLAYPAVVAVAAIALVVFLISSIVPTFQSMYDQMHIPLPRITQLLIQTGTLLSRPGSWLIVSAGFSTCVLLWVALGAQTRRAALELAVNRLPLIAKITQKTAAARVARTLGMLLRSGVGLMNALDVTANTMSNRIWRENLDHVRKALDGGSTLSAPLAESGLYDGVFIQMVRVGEEAGALDAMLLRIADYYELDVETLLGALGSIVEPAIIISLGGVVGFIVAAIYIPLYTLIGSIK